MKYYAPSSVEEALSTIAEVGDDGGKVLAGGQSLVPAMNFRMAQPTALVDLNGIKELFYIKPSPEGGLLIGTMTRDRAVELDPLVIERAPMIPECLYWIAHPNNSQPWHFRWRSSSLRPGRTDSGCCISLEF